MLPEIDRILIDRERISQRVHEMGEQLAKDLSEAVRTDGHDPLAHPDRVVMVPILTGAMVFAADLIRAMPMKLSLRLVTVSSYPGQSTESKGAAMRSALPADLADRHVVLIDDILDTGSTLKLVSDLVAEQSPASIRCCVLLDKPDRRQHDIRCDYNGFSIPDEFVVGYGLDYDGFYRNLPDIVALRPDAFRAG
ncbi:MAG: hypoxanthine phosphoribosyltransferase [Phycisphaerales bacterium JB065]